jgi:colanic acid/amylovoran biosynthesis protein
MDWEHLKKCSVINGIKNNMKHRKNILVVGQPTNNRGDQAQGVALAYSIKKLVPDINITYIFFQQNFPVHKECNFINNVFINAKRKLAVSIRNFFLFKEDEILALVKNAEIVVLPPGGPSIGDMYSLRYEIHLAVFIFFAKHYCIKTMIYAPSMGPFQKWWRKKLHKYILKRADVICVRDQISHKWAKSLKLKKEIYLTADAAIQRILTPQEIKKHIAMTNIPLPDDRIKVGITPIDLNWHPVFGKRVDIEEFNERIASAFANAIIHMIKKKMIVYFYPQLYGNQDDMRVISGIVIKVKRAVDYNLYKDSINILNNKYNADYQQAHISMMDYFIGTRYHSIVFSAMYHVPFVGIYYEHKAEDFIKRLSMIRYSLPIEDIDSDLIINKLNKLKKNKAELQKMLDGKMKPIKELSFQTSKYLCDLYEQNN